MMGRPLVASSAPLPRRPTTHCTIEPIDFILHEVWMSTMFEFTERSSDTANLDMCCELNDLIDFWSYLTPPGLISKLSLSRSTVKLRVARVMGFIWQCLCFLLAFPVVYDGAYLFLPSNTTFLFIAAVPLDASTPLFIPSFPGYPRWCTCFQLHEQCSHRMREFSGLLDW